MSEIAPGWKLRVLLAQALFADPDVMLLDEPTNNLDIDTIRWLEGVLNERKCTMIIISHDRHFLNTVCTHMADLDYGELRVFPGNYDEYMTAATQARERVAIVGANGIGKTTLLRCIMGEYELDHGTVKWAENADAAYMPQDHGTAFDNGLNVFDWMHSKRKPRDDDQAIRATLGRLLFSRDEMAKGVDKLSGGERGRMLFGEITLKRPNIIIMDEPTNHLDMESIESLNLALENFPGTVIFVSHDRQFVASIATRIIELKPTGVIDFTGNYDDYLRSRGIAIDYRRAASQ
jgi:ATPase subunit of ABC transporter with duplicated ATPase domains